MPYLTAVAAAEAAATVAASEQKDGDSEGTGQQGMQQPTRCSSLVQELKQFTDFAEFLNTDSSSSSASDDDREIIEHALRSR